MLEEDENGDVIVEHGDNHREVYVSGSNDALSLNDIAALEGVSVSQITQSWLASHSEYGSSPDMALDAEAGMRLWYGITGSGSEPSSHWLLFERGYEYDDLGGVIDWGTVGRRPAASGSYHGLWRGREAGPEHRDQLLRRSQREHRLQRSRSDRRDHVAERVEPDLRQYGCHQ